MTSGSFDSLQSRVSTEPAISLGSPRLNPTDQYIAPEKSRRRMWLGSTSVALALFLLTSPLDQNIEAAQENITAATNQTDLNDKVSELASTMLDYPVRVECNNDAILNAMNTDLALPEGKSVKGRVHRFTFLTVPVAPPVMTIRSTICESFANTAPIAGEIYKQNDLALNFAHAAYVLLHEGEHTKQIHEESVATCYALQKLPLELMGFGFDQNHALDNATRVASLISGDDYSEYSSPECRPGGALDLYISPIYTAAIS